jgi:tRNA(Phe) wybutosine-synthesizing methylase Tyw3
MQNNCTNCVNSNTCKSCEVYKKLIRQSNKQLSESNKRIKLLEKELNDLKKQKFFATNNKSYDLCDERQE